MRKRMNREIKYQIPVIGIVFDNDGNKTEFDRDIPRWDIIRKWVSKTLDTMDYPSLFMGTACGHIESVAADCLQTSDQSFIEVIVHFKDDFQMSQQITKACDLEVRAMIKASIVPLLSMKEVESDDAWFGEKILLRLLPLDDTNDIPENTGIGKNAYLEELGLKPSQYGTNFTSLVDNRQTQWVAEQAKYGFDSRETWCMDKMFIEWLYSRMRMFVDCNTKDGVTHIDMDKAMCEYNTIRDGILVSETHSMTEVSQIIIDACKWYLTTDAYCDEFQRAYENMKSALHIWAETFAAFWW